MEIHQDEFEIGIKIYTYSFVRRDEEWILTCRVGEVCKNLYKDSKSGLYRDLGKIVRFNSGDPLYFNHRVLPLEEFYNGRVNLLEDNLQQAKEIFLEHEEESLARLMKELKNHEEKIRILKKN